MTNGTLRVGQQAPDFTATAVVDQEFKEISLSQYRGTYVVLFLPVMGLLTSISIDDVIKSFQINEKSNLGLWQPIIWPLRAVVPVAFALLFIQGISELLKSLWAVNTGTELVRHEKIEI